MFSLSDKHAVLGIVTLTTILMTVLPGLGLNAVSIPSHGTIDYGIDTRVGQFENGTYYVEVVNNDGTSETVYKSADADEVINYAISLSIAGTVFVSYTGSDYEIDDTINMKTGVTLLLDDDVRIKQTVGKSIVRFVGTAEHHLMYAHINSLGRAVFYGSGLSGNMGFYFEFADNCSLRNCEVVNTGSFSIVMRRSDYNILENLYCHLFARAWGSKAIELDATGYSKILNCTVDGADTDSSTLIYIGSNYDRTGMYNEIIGCQLINSATSSGIYCCSAGNNGLDGRVDHVTIKDVYISNCGSGLGSGDCGIKLRPCSYCTVEGVFVEGCDMGIEVSTHLGGRISSYPHSHDNYIQGTFSNNLACGINIGPAKDGMQVKDNVFDVITENNGHHGIRISSGHKGNCEVSYNTFQVESRGNGLTEPEGSGIWMETSGTTVMEDNDFTGVLEDNHGWGMHISGANCINTVFTGVLQNNAIGDIYNTGTNTTINLETLSYGSVSGTVTDSETGEAIQNVTVTCGSKTCQTDADGQYSLSNMTVGRRTLMATKDGYLDYITSVEILEDQTTIHNIELIEEEV